MSEDRIDRLLDEALISGVLPSRASSSERAEIEQLLAAAASTRALQSALDAESRAALPSARARFERFVAAEAAAPVQPKIAQVSRPSFFGRAFALHRRLTLVGSATAIGLIVLVAGFVSQSYGGVETASAQVLNENDYAQVQGVITATSGEGAARKATLSSEFGDLQIGLGELASMTNADQLVEPSTLKPGDAVTVAGTVAKKDKTTSIAARTLAIVKANVSPPARPKVTLLRELRKGLEGRITVFAVAEDGKSARVLVDVGSAEQFVVVVNARTLGELLNGSETAVGRRVMVSQEPGSPKGEFSLTSLNAPGGQPSPVARPGAIAGLVLARDGNVLRVMTDRGTVQVVVTLQTRIAIGPEAGLTADRFRGGNLAIGHAVIIQGGVDRATGQLVADVIWVGAKPLR